MEFKNLDIVFENATEASVNDKELFCKMRRAGLGASESSILLGINKYKKLDKLIQEKLLTEVSEEEKKVGKLPAVRKGAELEPIVLHKAELFLNEEVHKPEAMYKFKEYPYLTVNFDGVTKDGIPVEAKLITKWGEKNWGTALELDDKFKGCEIKMATVDDTKYVTDMAAAYGVPSNYYTQLQQQMLALDAPFGYLAALFDDKWELHMFKVWADKRTQNLIIEKGKEVWEIIQESKDGREEEKSI